LTDNGSSIFNGSVHNYLGQPGLAAYAATKSGLVSMARAIAADLAPRKIRVNVVAPEGRRRPSGSAGAQIHARGLRKAFRLLLVDHSAWPLGRAGGFGQGCAFSCLRRFFVHQRYRADGGLTGAPFGASILRA
jgi:NAD(P)-dependent dehydrogenase (short-subunit alcohol dehydrogenase family)